MAAVVGTVIYIILARRLLQKYPSMTLTYPSMALTTTTLLTYIMQALSWRQVQDNASLQAT